MSRLASCATVGSWPRSVGSWELSGVSVFVVRAGLCALAAVGCGKKGSPLPPIVRIPAQVDTITARRVGSDVYVTLTVPRQNVDASIPADVSRIEVFGYTGRTAPPRPRWPALGTRIGTVPVAPAPLPGAATPPVPPDPDAGAVQGFSATLVDTLTSDELVQGPVDPPLPPRRGAPPPLATPAPVVPAVPPPMRRFYLAIPFSPRGRPGPPGAAAEVTLTDIPDAPADMRVAYDAGVVSVAWEPSGGLLGFLLDREIANGVRRPSTTDGRGRDARAAGAAAWRDALQRVCGPRPRSPGAARSCAEADALAHAAAGAGHSRTRRRARILRPDRVRTGAVLQRARGPRRSRERSVIARMPPAGGHFSAAAAAGARGGGR